MPTPCHCEKRSVAALLAMTASHATNICPVTRVMRTPPATAVRRSGSLSVPRNDRTSHHTRLETKSSEQPLRGDPRALAQRRELGPDHVFGDAPAPGRGVEAAIGAGHHAPRIADVPRHAFEPVGDDLGMLDEIGQRIDDAGDDDLVVVQRQLRQARDTRARGADWRTGSTKPPTLACADGRQDVGAAPRRSRAGPRNCPSRRAAAPGRAGCSPARR